jgi:hypothetical protein
VDFLSRSSQTLNAIHRGIVVVENPLVRPEFGSFPPNRFLFFRGFPGVASMNVCSVPRSSPVVCSQDLVHGELDVEVCEIW